MKKVHFLFYVHLEVFGGQVVHCEFYFLSGKHLKEEIVTLEEDLLKLTDELQQEAQSIPNMTHPDVPLGGEDSSTVRKMVLLV